ncbi:MFS transporter [Vibrio ostreicida]|uniref:MFS transporter n=2 Tax=Vibrio ostreicida TaxID=526588 RepID=A0ABT8BWJ0_9VIBR|nr:MFS transporter [Vibrio ostreicida]MDN3610448.1 MFS transporter [Vibrio ostreicida]
MHKSFLYFTVNSLCVLMAARLSIFSISWWIVEQTGNASELAQMMAFALFIEVGCRFLCANLGDLFNKKLIVIITSAITGLSSTALYLAICNDLHMVFTWLAVMTISICNAIRLPVNDSILKLLVPDYCLSQAISINQTVKTFGSMGIPIISGALISLTGVEFGLLVAVIASFISIASVSSIPYKHQPQEPSQRTFISLHRSSWHNFLRIYPEVVFAITCALLNGVMFTFFSVFVPFLANSTSSNGAWIMGLLDGAFSLGLFLGAMFILRKKTNKSIPAARTIIGFAVMTLMFLIVALIVLYQQYIPNMITMPFAIALPLVASGTCLFLINNSISIIRMRASPHSSLASIIGFSSSISGGLIPISLLFGGKIIDIMGMEAFCFVTAGVMAFASLILALSPHIRAITYLKESELSDLYTKRYINT